MRRQGWVGVGGWGQVGARLGLGWGQVEVRLGPAWGWFRGGVRLGALLGQETGYFRYNHVFLLVQTRIVHVSPRITSYHVRIGPIPADTGIGPVSAKK